MFGSSFRFPPIMGYPMMMGSSAGAYNWNFLMIGTPLIFAALVIVLGAIRLTQMNSADLEKIRTGSILPLIAAMIAFLTIWVGTLLMLVGAILGISMSAVHNKFESKSGSEKP